MPTCPTKKPSMFALPKPRLRASTGGEERECLTLHLQTITPIYGGSTKPRHVEDHEPIRVPSIRGCLLFWWRALVGHTYKDSAALCEAQKNLWGGVFGEDGARSKVEIAVKDVRLTKIDKDDIKLSAPDAYALFPARSQKSDGTPPAERWKKGVAFRLEVRVPKRREEEIKQTLRAWLMFGGYGGRTRRGLGSLTVTEKAEEWLPKEASVAEFQRLLGEGVFQDEPAKKPSQTPSLVGAQLYKSEKTFQESEKAWYEAIGWLKDFRQAPGGTADHAREPGSGRPGRSRWPEADKIRHLSGPGPWAHTPRHNQIPVWPRASFGLPILGQFQKKDANGQPYKNPEPRNFEIAWYEGETKKNRLASPLFVKPLALAGGEFVAIALWMYRAFPVDGKVGFVGRPAHSKADFDDLVAAKDTVLYTPLHTSTPKPFAMRDAFFQWVARCRSGMKA